MLIRSSEVEARGLTRSEMLGLVRRGEARQVRPGVWSLAEVCSPEERHRELMSATVPGLRGGAVVSHASAAVLHGLPVPERGLDRVHVLRPGRGGKRSGFLHVHRDVVDASEVVLFDGMAVTSLLRTAVDLARALSPMDALAVVDRGLALGIDRDQALEEVARAARRPHNARARAAFVHGDARAESPGESWSRWRMIELGIPLPNLQVRLFDDAGQEIARPDFLWERQKLVGEFDGEVKYGRLLKPGQDLADVIRAEKDREERIRRRGYWMVRWATRDLHPAERFRQLMADVWPSDHRAG
ncbi:hypothetical protein [Mariniluteicoccus flavus]